MEPGRELDALIAEKVMGWEWVPVDPGNQTYSQRTKDIGGFWLDGTVSVMCTNDDGTPNCPHYSTDISAAFDVVEKLYATDEFEIRMETDQGELNYWIVEIQNLKSLKRVSDSSASLPHAICLAALDALK